MNKYPSSVIMILMTVITIIFLCLFISNWNRLAKLYRTKQPPPPNLRRRRNGYIGLIYFNATLDVGITSEGIYLSIFPLFSFALPPVLIPWQAIERIESANRLFVQRYCLYLNSPKMRIILDKKDLQPAKDFLAARGIDI